MYTTRIGDLQHDQLVVYFVFLCLLTDLDLDTHTRSANTNTDEQGHKRQSEEEVNRLLTCQYHIEWIRCTYTIDSTAGTRTACFYCQMNSTLL